MVIPANRDYLVAETRYLDKLFETSGASADHSRLTPNGLRWSMAQNTFDECPDEVYETGSCPRERVQEILPSFVIGSTRLPGRLPAAGAVVFGRVRQLTEDHEKGFWQSLSDLFRAKKNSQKCFRLLERGGMRTFEVASSDAIPQQQLVQPAAISHAEPTPIGLRMAIQNREMIAAKKRTEPIFATYAHDNLLDVIATWDGTSNSMDAHSGAQISATRQPYLDSLSEQARGKRPVTEPRPVMHPSGLLAATSNSSTGSYHRGGKTWSQVAATAIAGDTGKASAMPRASAIARSRKGDRGRRQSKPDSSRGAVLQSTAYGTAPDAEEPRLHRTSGFHSVRNM
jgi:hypothetical protein